MPCRAQSVVDVLNADTVAMTGFSIRTPKGYLSGICAMKNSCGVTDGSVMNEFGITAFSFRYDGKKQKVTLSDVIPFLNKWYIKRVIKGDLAYLFANVGSRNLPAKGDNKASLAEKKRTLTVAADTITLINNRHNITYNINIISDEAAE